MSKKKIIEERNKQLRLLVTRAKDDSERWGTDQKCLLLRGIKETSAFDFSIYDDAYQKFLKKRKDSMDAVMLHAAEDEERKKNETVSHYSEVQRNRTEFELKRIADALERIAELLETANKKDL